MISDHCISVLIIICMCRQIIIDELECFYSIIVICIDHCERSVNLIHTAIYSMCCSPRFYTSFRYFIAFRNVVDILISICYVHVFFHTFSHMLFELFFDLVFDYEYDLLKAGSLCIIHGKIHDNMSVIVYRI